MVLIDQHTKAIMEGCKERARQAGLRFSDETLEYIVTNRDLLELSPKIMIPTMYDYWVHELEVLREKGRYELYPRNPYESVINTRPPMSFYNDNNPDWLNVLIFYHVLGHIDFFQNNVFFGHTWDDDFTGQALADKRLISRLRVEHGRWADYAIEFSRGIDNLAGYYQELSSHRPVAAVSKRVDYYFDVFVQTIVKVTPNEYLKEIKRYNRFLADDPKAGESKFFARVEQEYPEFREQMRKFFKEKRQHRQPVDLLQYVMEHSERLAKKKNWWIKSIMEVVRNTSIYFQPQIRTKIMNEGWASYWHDRLFRQDDRIKGHEVDFARTHAGVTSIPRVGLNPYAIGMCLWQFMEEWADQGKYSMEFNCLRDEVGRRRFDRMTQQGQDFIFKIRQHYSDFLFVNDFVNQDFVDKHELFVAGERLDFSRGMRVFYVKSRRVEDYRQMLFDHLYHPPFIEVDESKGGAHRLYLVHRFEGKPLVKEYIFNTMLGLEWLWEHPVYLETHEVKEVKASETEGSAPDIEWEKVRYSMSDRKLQKKPI